jgi:short-subunit dehydrogenase
MKLKGKIAVVVGASGGIGREIVKALAKEGADIVLVARRKNILNGLAEEVSRYQIKTYIYVTDITKASSINELSKKLGQHFKKIDMLFNVAGVGIYKKLEDLTIDDWCNSLNINVTAPFLVTQRLMFLLKRSTSAVVVSFGSGMGKIGLSGRSAYCTSKFALRGLMLSLAKEYKNTNVKICLATLGSVLTSFGPLSLEKKVEKQKEGKEYLKPFQVAHTVISKIENDSLTDEFSIYPKDYYKESREDKR